MIIVQNAYLSDDIAEKMFVCDLERCKGACCTEGDSGAPLEEAELPVLEEVFEAVKPFLTPAGLQAIQEQGKYVIDEDGDLATPTVGNRECAYATYDAKGVLKCAIEQAYLAGKIAYRKPISCHLYPIRVTKYDQFEALNYHRWQICDAACTLGSSLQVPLYKFLREPLVRKYGQAWYDELLAAIAEREPTS
ncbi:MAG: hypothetical protein AVDCRST_MAG56-6128 [uncultured Cytophagales bacterium]|uniref:DUF3109 family protein n=1 Tax=uncultured Cytophagales bacterium TaxID=158755 RepID=A0A6J4KL90_9SPHI|nr:MAG: hypothetical protein AVDCRST_MAG56-6128 [uncultured Cytophagales bacterium]